MDFHRMGGGQKWRRRHEREGTGRVKQGGVRMGRRWLLGSARIDSASSIYTQTNLPARARPCVVGSAGVEANMIT